jgi:hypothetical protein
MAIVGGTATLWGAPVGAVFMTLLPELMQRAMPDAAAADRAAQFQQILFGLLLIVVMIAQPDGLTGLLGGVAGPPPSARSDADRVRPTRGSTACGCQPKLLGVLARAEGAGRSERVGA